MLTVREKCESLIFLRVLKFAAKLEEAGPVPETGKINRMVVGHQISLMPRKNTPPAEKYPPFNLLEIWSDLSAAGEKISDPEPI